MIHARQKFGHLTFIEFFSVGYQRQSLIETDVILLTKEYLESARVIRIEQHIIFGCAISGVR